MVNFPEVDNAFKEKGCKLLIDEEEFNKNKHSTIEKYKYIASCGHEHEVWLNVFKNRGTGIICPKCIINTSAKFQKENAILNPLKNSNLEYENLIYFKEINESSFDIKLTREGCLADLALKPKNITHDLWMLIQVKSTIKPLRGYNFKCDSKYENCIILCICQSDKRMWAFDGNTINVKSKIAIGLYNSKYSEFEISIENVVKKFNAFYKTFPKYNFNIINTPISECQQLEYEYVRYREQKINLGYIYSDKQGLVYDFILNGYRVQEKVGYTQKKNGVQFSLHKNNGKINGCREFTSYKKGDADFYWLNIPNKQHFYIIPENELIERKYINIDTKKTIYLNPESDDKSWSKAYLFEYTKPDLDKIKTLFK